METDTKPTDAELLAQLVLAASERSCSIDYAVRSAYELGIGEGRLQQAKAAVEMVKGAQ